VENNALNCQLMRELLEVKDYTVVAANTIAEARVLLAATHFDIVLLDMSLSEGEQLLGEIRAQQSSQHLPVIAVTALALHSDSERLLAAGFDGYFSRPISTRSFVPELEAFVQKTRPAR
jgi:two-component system cell cycle response regulator DivK